MFRVQIKGNEVTITSDSGSAVESFSFGHNVYQAKHDSRSEGTLVRLETDYDTGQRKSGLHKLTVFFDDKAPRKYRGVDYTVWDILNSKTDADDRRVVLTGVTGYETE